MITFNPFVTPFLIGWSHSRQALLATYNWIIYLLPLYCLQFNHMYAALCTWSYKQIAVNEQIAESRRKNKLLMKNVLIWLIAVLWKRVGVIKKSATTYSHCFEHGIGTLDAVKLMTSLTKDIVTVFVSDFGQLDCSLNLKCEIGKLL